MPDSLPPRLDQGMAVEASRAVPDPVNDQVRTRLRQLPVMLQTSGLAATLAFLHAKSGAQSPLEHAYRDVADALTGRVAATIGMARTTTTPQLVEHLGGLSGDDYVMAAAHARAFAGWLSRIAEGRPRAQHTGQGQGS